jgi:membrane protein
MNWRFLTFMAAQFSAKEHQKSAAALTYMTLFAIVPLMTVTYSMFSVIPAFQGLGDQLQGFIFAHFMPDTGEEVKQYLGDFSSQARSLSGFGVLMLVVTAYLMLKNIEKTFNAIWGVKTGRKGLSNFLLYWAILSLGPLLLGLGLAVSTYLLSLKFMVKEYDALGLLPWLLSTLPWLLTWSAFTLLFAAVPNCKVPFKQAAIGGLITSLCFEALKTLFSFVVAKTSISAIYGAFAFVPRFLLWIYLLWMIILGGAILVRTLTSWQVSMNGLDYPDLMAALIALWEFQLRLSAGDSLTDSDLSKAGVASEQWHRVRDALLDARVISVTQNGDYVLCRDLNTLNLRDLADMLALPSYMPGVSDYLQNFDWFPRVAERLMAIDQYVEQQFDLPLAEIFQRLPESKAEVLSEEEADLGMLKDALSAAEESHNEAN